MNNNQEKLYKWNPSNFETQDSKFKCRKKILELLSKSYMQDYANDKLDLITYNKKLYNKDIKVRYYKMTKEEYLNAKPFCFYVIFENTIKIDNKEIICCEMWCYDIRTLMHEKYLTLSLQPGFIPLLMSKTRWNYIRDSENNLAFYSQFNGILTYPLLVQETVSVTERIKNEAIICSQYDKCIPTSTSELKPFILKDQFDESPVKRFGPKVYPVGTYLPDIEKNETITLTNEQFLELQNKSLMMLKDIGLDKELIIYDKKEMSIGSFIQNYLKPKLLEHMQRLTSYNEDVLVGFIIDEVLKILILNE